MPRYALVFALLCFGLTATIARAAELEGFGPIKFGMTKEEAWAAIDGKGKWKSDWKLSYGFEWEAIGKTFEVEQHFVDGRASVLAVNLLSDEFYFRTCVSDSLRIVSAITEKYKKTPLVRLQNRDKLYKRIFVTDSYFFGFGNDSSIEVTLWFWTDSNDCELTVWYRPPSAKPLPF